jgi:CDP-6-deoxy-D-xylo-4-hexulose-3-dehydrase
MSGALGIEQVKKLPHLITERRKNGALFQRSLANHSNLLIQSEIGHSSWFGFSLVIKPGSTWTRRELVNKLTAIGFECRPIVTGNFAKNEVVKYFDSEVHGQLKNAEHVDKNGLFIGNHHYSITDAINQLQRI